MTKNDSSFARPASPSVRRTALSLLCGTALSGIGLVALSLPAAAERYDLGDGWEAITLLDLSVGAAMRTRSADSDLIAIGNGGRADGTTTDDGNANYGRGDFYSVIGKALGEFQMSKDGFGVFVRGKAWYDLAGDRGKVPLGHSANGYARDGRLNDGDFFNLSKFKGAALLDAYVYGDVNLSSSSNLGFKVGNHVVNWGESLFVSGINQYNIIDASAARRPGAQLKEVLLPIPQISVNLGLGDGLSAEAFYQLAWRHSTFEGCGTYWAPTDLLNCSGAYANITPAPFGDRAAHYGLAALGGANTRMQNAGRVKPSGAGQWGAALRYFSADLGADFGAYYAQYHTRMPNFSMVRAPSQVRGSLYGARPAQYFEDYSAEDIKVAGASFATEIGGWSVGGEISRSFGVPVQINTTDMVQGVVSGQGPLARLALSPIGTVIRGYDRKDKTQIQLSTIKTFPHILGADNLRLIGEVAYQHWSGIGDPATSTRYGRSPLFSRARTATTPCGTLVAEYCDPKGYATSNSWGVRAQASMTYTDVFAGVNLTPRVSVAWDISGHSPDGTFIEDRVNVGVGVRADLLQRYYADLTYSFYNRSAKYDSQRDRDFIALVVGATF